jgi:hypothetical protein
MRLSDVPVALMTDFPGVLSVFRCLVLFFGFLCLFEQFVRMWLTPRMGPDDPLDFFKNALVGMCKCSQGKYGQAKLIHDD